MINFKGISVAVITLITHFSFQQLEGSWVGPPWTSPVPLSSFA